MSILILSPATPVDSASGYTYVFSADGRHPTSQGSAVPDLLPPYNPRTTELVLMVAAQRLSWHRVQLPQRVRAQLLGGRLDAQSRQAILAGLLEEHLLEDPAQLHFAVAEGGSGPDGLWVAVCARDWLREHVHRLEAAGHIVARLLPEIAPREDGQALVVVGPGMVPAQMLVQSAQGAAALPLTAGTAACLENLGAVRWLAQPAQAALAEQMSAGAVELQSAGEYMLALSHTAWNLAQGEFSLSRGQRWRKRVADGWQQWLQAPHWRPVRWGLVALVLVQVLALNALAWRTRNQLAQRRTAIAAVLTQTFPEVPVVLDAPLQMQRAVDALARERGAGGSGQLSQVLSALSGVGATASLSALDLSLDGVDVQLAVSDPAALQGVQSALSGRGLQAQRRDGGLHIVPGEGP